MREARLWADCQNDLGEGPLAVGGRLIWFDINRARLFCAAAAGAWRVFDLPCRASAAMETADGKLLVAAERGLVLFDLDAGALLGDFAPLEAIATNRSNDGKGAPDGAFWIGTMDCDARSDCGAIYRVTAKRTINKSGGGNGGNGDEGGGGGGDGGGWDARFRIQKRIAPLTIPNALAFSPDGKILYYADSPRRRIWACALADNGEIADRRVFASLEGGAAAPDGAAVDAEGHLWVALWDGARVVRYAPDGAAVDAIALPVSRPTCPAFGGADWKTLFIISAREGLSAADLAKQPQAGGVFAAEADVAGIAPPVFGGK